MSAGTTARTCIATAFALMIAGCAAAPRKTTLVPQGTPAIAVQAMGTDGLRVVFPGDSCGFTNAVILSSTNANYAGHHVVMTTYVCKESTRHLIMMYCPETGETQCHTYVTVRLAEAEGPDPSQPGAHKAKAFLNDRYAGKKVYVNATPLCPQGCMVGTVLTRSGENIGQALVTAGLAQPSKGQRPTCAPHDQNNMKPGYSYNVIDAVVEGKTLGVVGDMPAAKPTPRPAAAKPAKEGAKAETPAKDETKTEAPAKDEATTETPAKEEPSPEAATNETAMSGEGAATDPTKDAGTDAPAAEETK